MILKNIYIQIKSKEDHDKCEKALLSMGNFIEEDCGFGNGGTWAIYNDGGCVYRNHDSGILGMEVSLKEFLSEYGLINNNKNNNIMSNIVEFAKNLVLSSEEKLLRKQGLKNECGNYTSEAKELVINKLVAENEAYLIDIATKKEASEKEEK